MDLSKKEIEEALRNGKLTVCVVGLGRIGLPIASVLADAGAQVSNSSFLLSIANINLRVENHC